MEGKEGEGAWRARGAAAWQAPHRDHILVIEVYRMVIKLKGALISLPQPKCLSEERSVWTGSAGQQGWEQVRKEKGYCEKSLNTLGNATTLFWGITKSAFVLDKSFTPF